MMSIWKTFARTTLARWWLGAALLLVGASAGRAEKLVLIAGGAESGDRLPATQFRLNGPFGVDFDSAGNLYSVEIAGHRVLKLDSQGVMTRIGGTGAKGEAGDNGPALQAQFNGMHSLAVDRQGHLFVADTWNHRVRKVQLATGQIVPWAGTGEKGDTGDGGPAVAAKLGGIYCIALEPGEKRLIVTDLDNRRIRAVDQQTGTLTLLAGNGQRGVPADGAQATAAPLVDPRAAVVDSQGQLYILERGGHALRVVDTQGKIRTVAGTGTKGFSGDGGPALQAQLNGPKHLCVDRDDSILIADTENHVIRRYLPRSGRIVRVAGTGKKGTAGVGGDPLTAEFFQPHGVDIHPTTGRLYITDSGNNRILRIDP